MQPMSICTLRAPSGATVPSFRGLVSIPYLGALALAAECCVVGLGFRACTAKERRRAPDGGGT
jgi:hypothetical protein